jgi:hypothetical protein
MVVVAVGGHHAVQKLLGPLGRLRSGRTVTWISASKAIRDTFSLIRMGSKTRRRACFQRHQPQPATVRPRALPRPSSAGLENLAVLHPQVAPQGQQRPDAQDGHGQAVHLEGPGLVGVGRVAGFWNGRLVGADLVGFGPVGDQGAQQQARHQPLAGAQVGQRSQQGDERVGAGGQQVVITEGAQGHVVGAAGAQGQAPGLFTLFQAQGGVFRRHLPDSGLGVVGLELTLDHLPIVAAGHKGGAVGVAGQFQGEGLGYGDGLEQVLHAQKSSLASAGRRHRQQDGRPPEDPPIAEEYLAESRFHVRSLLSIVA